MRRLALVLMPALMVASGCSQGAQNANRAPLPSGSAGPVATATPVPTPPSQLTLSALFHPAAPPAGDAARLRTMNATGDVIPARGVDVKTTQLGDYLWPFRPTADHVRNADVTFINLEAPLLAGCRPDPLNIVCGDVRFVDGLKLIGTKVANVANNHVYPGPNTERTKALLEQNGIGVTTDVGPPVVLDVRGLKFAFVGCNAVAGPRSIDREALRADVAQARQLADVVIVQFHWGREYVRLPDTAAGLAEDDPVQLGHLAIDAGADIVIGNHPHWVQAVEIYKNHLITYAHGNYVFDQVLCYPRIGPDYATFCSDDTRTSVIGTYTFYDKQLVAASWRPTFTDTNLQTQWADPARSQRVLKTMEDASVQLAQKEGEPTG